LNANCAHELTTWNVDAVRPLFSGLRPHPLHLSSVLAGHSSGTVFVDRIDHPKAAVVLAGEGCYVGGAPTGGFLRKINSLLPRDLYTAIFFPPNLPSRALDALGDGLYMRRAVRWHGRLRMPPHKIAGRRDGIAVRCVDAEALGSHLGGVDDLRETILWEWKTLPLFLELGFGSIAVTEGRIVGWSTSDYAVGEACEIGVWVAADLRLRGLAAR
jgi:hypothetical protein